MKIWLKSKQNKFYPGNENFITVQLPGVLPFSLTCIGTLGWKFQKATLPTCITVKILFF